MRFSTALALASAPLAVFGATQVVTVGANNMLMYSPSNITAAQGDIVQFQFASKNHSVTQSTFAAPCTKAPTAINSGFLATPANSTATNGSMPTWSIQIQNASTPLWFYCAQKVPVSHCQMGMVFSINATPQKTFDAFQAAAKASPNTTTPAPADASGNSTASAPADASGNSTASAPADASGNSTASGSGDAASSGAASSTVASGAAAAAAGTSAASSASGTQDASNAATSSQAANGASKTAFRRGAAGLLTVAAVGAVLL